MKPLRIRLGTAVLMLGLGCSDAPSPATDAGDVADVMDLGSPDLGQPPADTGVMDVIVARDAATSSDAGALMDAQPPVDAGPTDAQAMDDGGMLPPCNIPVGSQPQKMALFVDQWPAQDLELEDALIELLQAALPGSEVRVGLYSFSRERMADAMVAAHVRGVDVQAVLDEDNLVEQPAGSGQYAYRAAVQRLITGLGPGRVTVCNEANPPDGGGCQGTGINHNKFFLFSALCDGSQNVVVQSSANLTNPQLRLHNNMVIIRDDPDLHLAYRGYWVELQAGMANPNPFRTESGSTGTQASFFPRAEGASAPPDTDPIHEILSNDVDCSFGGRIRVMMAYWTNVRGYLVDDLAQLQTDGCDVRVIVSRDSATAALKTRLENMIAADKRLIVNGVHSKYLLIDTRFQGTQRRLLWTGSHNYTGAALRNNDETLLRIDDAAVFDAFDQNWQDAWVSLGG